MYMYFFKSICVSNLPTHNTFHLTFLLPTVILDALFVTYNTRWYVCYCIWPFLQKTIIIMFLRRAFETIPQYVFKLINFLNKFPIWIFRSLVSYHLWESLSSIHQSKHSNKCWVSFKSFSRLQSWKAS